MYKFLLVLLMGSMVLMAFQLPPALPASFYGTVSNVKNATIKVSVDGRVIAKTQTFVYQDQVVYTINVPMDEIADGSVAKFTIRGVTVGQAELYSGTNSALNLEFSGRVKHSSP